MKQNPYKRFARALAAVEKWIIVVALAIGVALTAVNVVCRYIFKANVNFSWSEEVVVALLVLTYMVGAALCSGDEGGLINMTIFTGKMSRRTQLVIEIITNLCLIAFGVIIFISGWDRCASKIASGQVTTASRGRSTAASASICCWPFRSSSSRATSWPKPASPTG